ncbi:MAG: hypothetical protein QF858_02980 [Candidatus Pacebacteria bacterium]|jgi:hypothetical protein|nr:hypothetical protein [Candidatus Paceibacterota bacterium]|tara:strand:+ start:765 stop:902 length:138 start_codon:yes stop_codon:yes gene_type:complete
MVTIVGILSARMAGNFLDAVMENVKKERQINVFVLIIIRNAKLLV